MKKSLHNFSFGRYARQKALVIGLSAAVFVGGYSFGIYKIYQTGIEKNALSRALGISFKTASDLDIAIKKAEKYSFKVIDAANVAYKLELYKASDELLEKVEEFYLPEALPEEAVNLRNLLEKEGY
jgi:hypothetical protein